MSLPPLLFARFETEYWHRTQKSNASSHTLDELPALTFVFPLTVGVALGVFETSPPDEDQIMPSPLRQDSKPIIGIEPKSATSSQLMSCRPYSFSCTVRAQGVTWSATGFPVHNEVCVEALCLKKAAGPTHTMHTLSLFLTGSTFCASQSVYSRCCTRRTRGDRMLAGVHVLQRHPRSLHGP